MSKTVAQVLSDAADLIEPEGAWTQGAYARGKSRREVVNPKRAVCFCALGAINVAAGEKRTGVDAVHYHSFFHKAAKISDVLDWNDAPERTQSEVVAKLREASKLAAECGL